MIGLTFSGDIKKHDTLNSITFLTDQDFPLNGAKCFVHLGDCRAAAPLQIRHHLSLPLRGQGGLE